MLPKVIMHNAVSVDGRFDWIEPDLGLFYGIVAGFKEDATLVGSETVLAAYAPGGSQGESDEMEDEVADGGPEAPSGEARRPDASLPLLAIPDSRGRLRAWEKLLREPYWRAGVALCSNTTPPGYFTYLDGIGVDHIVAGEDRVDMRAALEELASRFGVKVMRADCGGTLNGVLLRAGLVDEVSLVVDPAMVGGTSARSVFLAPDLESPAGVIKLELLGLERLEGGTVWLHYRVIR
jgi:2,5-diamino-6-(ribosylamino)-4(3H)-pyrimidinone 5'-phosphate reductase